MGYHETPPITAGVVCSLYTQVINEICTDGFSTYINIEGCPFTRNTKSGILEYLKFDSAYP